MARDTKTWPWTRQTQAHPEWRWLLCTCRTRALRNVIHTDADHFMQNVATSRGQAIAPTAATQRQGTEDAPMRFQTGRTAAARVKASSAHTDNSTGSDASNAGDGSTCNNGTGSAGIVTRSLPGFTGVGGAYCTIAVVWSEDEASLCSNLVNRFKSKTMRQKVPQASRRRFAAFNINAFVGFDTTTPHESASIRTCVVVINTSQSTCTDNMVVQVRSGPCCGSCHTDSSAQQLWTAEELPRHGWRRRQQRKCGQDLRG